MNKKDFNLWTIQSIGAWQELQKTGYLTGTEKFIEPCFKTAYRWINEQMKNRIENIGDRKVYPIWSWYQYHHSSKKKPDLRGIGFFDKGKEAVRIEFIKKQNEALLSDFDLWHYPLNNWYLGDNEEDALEFENMIKNQNLDSLSFDQLPLNIQNIIKKSWNRIFDMNFDNPYYSFPFDQKQIQATLWELKLDEVIKIDRFIAR